MQITYAIHAMHVARRNRKTQIAHIESCISKYLNSAWRGAARHQINNCYRNLYIVCDKAFMRKGDHEYV